MKRIVILLIFIVSKQSFTQTPEKFNYQAILRDSNNILLKNQTVGIQISILKDEVTVYKEVQTKNTNLNGLLSLVIGDGSYIEGYEFSEIPWSNGIYFIETDIDPDGGSNYTISTKTQLLSVPFSMYAKTAKEAENGVPLNGEPGQVLVVNDSLKPVWKNYTQINTFSELSFFNQKKINLLANQLDFRAVQYKDLMKDSTDLVSSKNSQSDVYLDVKGNYEVYYSDIYGKGYQKQVKGSSIVDNRFFRLKIDLEYCELIFALEFDKELTKDDYISIVDASSGASTYSLDGTIVKQLNKNFVLEVLNKKDYIGIYKVKKTTPQPNKLSLGLISKDNSTTKIVTIYKPVISTNKSSLYTSWSTIPEINNSNYIGKNIMLFGDSNMHTATGKVLIEQLGMSVFRNAAGGRRMAYDDAVHSSSSFDMHWLYHWERRKHILDLIDKNIIMDIFSFFVSYNDRTGDFLLGSDGLDYTEKEISEIPRGVTIENKSILSDDAIQAVYDNYPVIGDSDSTIAQKLAIFNSLSKEERKQIFGFKQVFAAYIKQLLNQEDLKQSLFVLCKILYSPKSDKNGNSNTDPSISREDKEIRDRMNQNLEEIGGWFGIPVIDTNYNAGYYFGNQNKYTEDGIHFNETIGFRQGFFLSKYILSTYNIKNK